MRRILLSTLMLAFAIAGMAQPQGFGGFGQPQTEPDWKDVNYAGDDLEAHRMDIYLPKTGEGKYKVVIAIYGSAWFANNMKGMTYMSLGKPLTDAGFAVVSINHRSSADAKFPAQINDVKAAIDWGKQTLGKDGRVVARVSGTEPLIRVMTEGIDCEKIEQVANRIADTVRERLS